MYSITANMYATHRVSLLTRLHQQQQPNNNIPLYTISDPPTERMPEEPSTPNVPAPPYTSVNSNPHNVELNR
ncbi:hypothetical protein BDC45DRAFT_161649 [Circinella umbellata]|nr:hypothetical protein BDC45DRAFT_161649 [Circinella umbellata]